MFIFGVILIHRKEVLPTDYENNFDVKIEECPTYFTHKQQGNETIRKNEIILD